MNANQTTKLGKLVSSEAGKCAGPKYGEVYTAPAGEHGYIAGYRSTANVGLGLMSRKWFPTLRQAQDYSVQVSG